MDIRPIKTEDDYDWALSEIASYFDDLPEQGTPDADRFDVLSALIEAYENRNWAIGAPDPVEMLKNFMEMSGRSQSDLARLFGSRSRASEVLLRKRRLNLEMIRRLSGEWGISPDLLLAPYQISNEAA